MEVLGRGWLERRRGGEMMNHAHAQKPQEGVRVCERGQGGASPGTPGCKSFTLNIFIMQLFIMYLLDVCGYCHTPGDLLQA